MSVRVEYEYATVRYVPDLDRGEFVNLGVVLYCRKQRYVNFMYEIQYKRIKGMWGEEVDLSLLEDYLESFEEICAGKVKEKNVIACMDDAERFRWLTANRSTILQCSPVHVGTTSDAEEQHRYLLERLVK